MAFTVKQIINNAYDRSGIFPNSTSTLPGEMTESALKLLQGIIQTYNIQGVLLPTQRRKEIKITSTSMKIPNEQFEDSVAGITKVYVTNGDEHNTELDFIPFATFDGCPSSYIYTYNQLTSNEFDIYFKKFIVGKKVIIYYVTPIECELNTEYYLPSEYEELFTLSLVVKLFNMYPRENTAIADEFKNELASVRNAIVAKQTENKLIMYNRYDYDSLWSLGNSGKYLGV